MNSKSSGAMTRINRIPGHVLLPQFATRHLRPITGVVVSAALVLAMWNDGNALVWSALLGGGWGLSLLYAVQLRGLKRGDGSASWSGVLFAAIVFPALAVPLVLKSEELLRAFDLTAIPLALVYIASKLGCHRIGCCDRPHMRRGLLSLPMLEVLATSAISVLVACALAVDGPDGLAFLVFLVLHVVSWQSAKRLRT